MIVKVCEMEWELNKKMVAPLPQSPVVCVENGTLDQVRLILLAVAKLRLGEIPSLQWYVNQPQYLWSGLAQKISDEIIDEFFSFF